MSRFNLELKPFVSSWLPARFEPRQFLEKTRVPHVALFSFGEPLPVLTHSISDPSLPGLAFENLASILATNLQTVGKIIDSNYLDGDSNVEYLIHPSERMLDYLYPNFRITGQSRAKHC